MAKPRHNFFHYLFTASYKLTEGLVSSLAWLFVGIAGYLIYKAIQSPFDLIFGIPFVLIGIVMATNKLWDSFLAIFSPTYNKGICTLCEEKEFKNHKSIKKILGL